MAEKAKVNREGFFDDVVIENITEDDIRILGHHLADYHNVCYIKIENNDQGMYIMSKGK